MSGVRRSANAVLAIYSSSMEYFTYTSSAMFRSSSTRWVLLRHVQIVQHALGITPPCSDRPARAGYYSACTAGITP
jgi:hypothetical protein